MSDTKISALPAIAAAADADMLPVVQGSGAGATTRRASLAQLRQGLLADRALHVREFGAVGDGIANDAPAIQAAIDAMAASGGGVLEFGPRTYRLASPVVISGVSVILQGAGFTEGPTVASGTWLTIDATGFTPFTFTGVAARGSVVRDLAIRQTHAAAQAPGWAPTDYDFVFRIQDCLGAVDFDNVFLCAVNRGIWCDNSGRLTIQRLRGQVFTTGIEMDRAYDVSRIEHVHFWPFATANDDVVRWQQQNQDTLVFRRVDGLFMDDVFVLGARAAVRFAGSAFGADWIPNESDARAQPEAWRAFMRGHLERYRAWQEEAVKGYRYISRRSRAAIKTAGDMYDWTGSVIAADPFVVFGRKVKPSKGRIVRQALWNLVRG